MPPVDDADALELAEQVRSHDSDAEAKVRLACALMGEQDNESLHLARELLTFATDEDPKCFGAQLGLACVADRLAQRRPETIVNGENMDLAEPGIAQGIAACAAAGAREIVVHPYFLGPGNHTTNDIPRLVETAVANHPDLVIRVSEPLGLHPKLVDVILDRVDAAVE